MLKKGLKSNAHSLIDLIFYTRTYYRADIETMKSILRAG